MLIESGLFIVFVFDGSSFVLLKLFAVLFKNFLVASVFFCVSFLTGNLKVVFFLVLFNVCLFLPKIPLFELKLELGSVLTSAEL